MFKFVKSYTYWSCEKYWSSELDRYPKLTYVIQNIENTFADTTTDFIRIFKYWGAVSVTVAGTSFPKL